MITGFAASFATVELLSQIKRFEATAEIVSNEPLLAQTPGRCVKPGEPQYLWRSAVLRARETALRSAESCELRSDSRNLTAWSKSSAAVHN